MTLPDVSALQAFAAAWSPSKPPRSSRTRGVHWLRQRWRGLGFDPAGFERALFASLTRIIHICAVLAILLCSI